MSRAFALFLAVFSLAPGQLDAQESPPASTSDQVTLQPGDSIRLKIWREEDMSGGFLVDENGVATLPLLGPVHVVDIPLEELRQQLLLEYQKLLRNPSITITPLRKVLVLGEVNRPGPYAVNPTETLLGVVALAGGATNDGDLNALDVVRDGRTVIEEASPGLTLNALRILSGDQIVLRPRSWFARNRTFLVSLLLALPSVVYTISRIN